MAYFKVFGVIWGFCYLQMKHIDIVRWLKRSSPIESNVLYNPHTRTILQSARKDCGRIARVRKLVYIHENHW